MTKLGDFQVIRQLGEGSCGKVFQVRKKNGDDINKIYAIKVVPLKYKGSARERRILTRIKHPMVVELFYMFKSETRMFFVLDYLCGGTLAFMLAEHNGVFSEQDASFYVKEVIVTLEYLHSKGIIHKDLKLHNILLDINGHIKLIDFGLSEENVTEDTLCFARCGTLYYTAPEVINRTGYGFAVDWWSLGILFYRMVAGRYPFGGNEEDKVRNAILVGKYPLPESLSINAKDLITRFLQPNPQERLGYTDGAAAVKNHPFFANTFWENVSQRLETPPFVPEVDDAADGCRYPVRFNYSTLSNSTNSGNPSAGGSSKKK